MMVIELLDEEDRLWRLWCHLAHQYFTDVKIAPTIYTLAQVLAVLIENLWKSFSNPENKTDPV